MQSNNCTYSDTDSDRKPRSIQQLLGGQGETIEVGTSHLIGDASQAFLKDIEAALAQGIRRIKIKVQPGWDNRPLALVREHFGDITLMANAKDVASHKLDLCKGTSGSPRSDQDLLKSNHYEELPV